MDRLIQGLPEHEYRAHPAISQSALKTLADCPARYQHELAHPRTGDWADFGSAVHTLALGAGPDVIRLDHKDRRAKTYKQDADQARQDGAIPLLAADYDRAKATAAATHRHQLANAILTHPGMSETSIFWTDPETGVECKARPDRVFRRETDDALVMIDFKTTSKSARPSRFRYAVADFGYHIQEAFYRWGWEQATGEPLDLFLFVVVETTAPHLVSVTMLDPQSVDAGHERFRTALDQYAALVESGDWYGYTTDVPETISVPPWAL